MYSGQLETARNRKNRSLRLLDLGSKVVAHVAHVGDLVLGDEGHIRGHAQSHCRRQRGGLSEKIQIAQSKGKGDRLLDLDDRSIVLLSDTAYRQEQSSLREV